ncbi:MAG: hypothetical protein AAF791_15490 [Bacteroidota bacterium]
MNFLSNPIVARLLWALPALMVVIAVGLVIAGVEQRETSASGVPVEAAVTAMEVRERSEITHGMVRLRYLPPAQTDSVERWVEFPLAFVKDIEQQYEADSSLVLPVRVSEANDQIILREYSRVQWVMTFAFAAMAAVGGIGLAFLVGGWNRFLAREGDPALRDPAEVD